ncbi:MAG TPA: SPOR domain-containing protein [Blastocatellia bacterium]|nr:SPOR domain-containing protein [Blastocatellia bacterium]
MRHARFLLSGILLLLSLSPAFAQSSWTTQIASFSTQAEADSKVSGLKAQGLDAYWIKSNVPGAGVRYRVRVGRFPTRAAAQAKGEQLRKQGIAQDFFATSYETPPKPAATEPMTPARTETQTAAATAPVRPRAVTAPTPTPTPATINQHIAIAPPNKGAASATAASTSLTMPGKAKLTRTPELTKPVKAVNPGFAIFEDGSVGYAFEHPSYWTGAAWGDAEKVSQNVDGGASFKSREDAAFLNVIWNKLPGANDPQKYDNTLLVDTIVRSMGSGTETKTLNEISRRVENESGQIRTYLDLNALFHDPATSTTLNFLGKAVITRCQRGILLVVVFYSQDAPPAAATNAERIIRSVRAPG